MFPFTLDDGIKKQDLRNTGTVIDRKGHKKQQEERETPSEL